MNILLIHGLGRTPLSLKKLERSLRQAAHNPEQFSYFAFAESFDAIVQRLQTRLRAMASQGSYAIVAHSLGGILTRVALADGAIPSPHHIIMLGTPNQPPRLAAIAIRFWPFQGFAGQCGKNLASEAFYQSLPPLNLPCTIIAGTAGPRGKWSPFGSEPNDGIVAVGETYLSGEIETIQFPVLHTIMMNDRQVQSAVLERLNRS